MKFSLLALAGLVLRGILTDAAAQAGPSSLEDFLRLRVEQLQTTTVYIEYLGPSSERLGPLIVTVDGRPIDLNGLRAAGLHIEDVEQKVRGGTPSFSVSVNDLEAFLRVVGGLPQQAPDPSREPWLQLTVVSGTVGQYRTLVRSIPKTQANDFFVLARGALRADPKDISIMNGGANLGAMRTLQSFGCALGLLPEVIPAKDVSDAVAVSRSGLRFNDNTHRFECTVTLTNKSPAAIKGPISLVLDLSMNVSLVNANGHTCVTKPVGREFVTFAMPEAVLRPGQALEKVLEFRGGEDAGIDFSTKVLATPGER